MKTLGLDGVTDLFMSDPDVTFYHPPSIYDFRERPEVIGPISDVIPSSPVFEMYPIGLTSIADTLERNGYNAQIVNLAHEMLVDSEFDAEQEIADSEAWMFGVDLHWLPHAHGAIEIAHDDLRLCPGTGRSPADQGFGHSHSDFLGHGELLFLSRS